MRSSDGRQITRSVLNAWRALAKDVDGDPAAFAPAWVDVAAGWSFREVNDLIGRHNRWYPIEARLAMDAKTGDYALVNGRSYRLDPLDAAWVLDRFPRFSLCRRAGHA